MKIIAAGNSFYGDDGIGAAVLEAVEREDTVPGAELVDIATDALSLIDHLEPGKQHVIVDAAQMGLAPGEVAAFRADEVKLRIRQDNLSVHGFGLPEAFAMAGKLGLMPDHMLIVGVEPERIEINQGLSDVVAAAVPRVLEILQAEVGTDG
ncbi:MAG: hydrogenase maturation protease [bacterium]|nr:hydrogenase maturation protease [bacterium]